jgi:hypothetical protein
MQTVRVQRLADGIVQIVLFRLAFLRDLGVLSIESASNK